MSDMNIQRHHHYQECGLDNIYVEGLKMQDDAEGQYIVVPAVGELHCLIAQSLLEEERPLNGDEFYFLRAELGMGFQELADKLGVSVAVLQQWQEKSKVSAEVDFSFRRFFEAIFQASQQMSSCWKQSIVIPSSYSQKNKSNDIKIKYEDNHYHLDLVA